MSSTLPEIVLITGANAGLGFEIAKKLLRNHNGRFHVLIGSRTHSKGEAAVQDLHSQGLKDCEFIPIDVTDNESITQAAATVQQKFGRLDVLHCNAGIAPDPRMLSAKEPISNMIMTTIHTNVAGAAQTAETFIPLLQKADNPRIIFMSSGLGSLSRASTTMSTESWPAYSTSKAALNMIMLWFWRRHPGMRVNACAPGFRATALNDFGAAGRPAGLTPGKLEDGAVNAERLTLLGKDGESGTFTSTVDGTGEVTTVPW